MGHESMKLNIREKITGLLVFYFLVALIAIGSTLREIGTSFSRPASAAVTETGDKPPR
jgi:hypothetical protein